MRKSEYPKNPKTLGEMIRKARMDLKLSLLDVANKANLSEGYLSRIEADKQVPNLQAMDHIAKALKMDPTSYSSVWGKSHFDEPQSSATFQSFISTLNTPKKK